MKAKENKKGISLIVLVITIIVIVILSLAVILSIANNNPIDNAKKAVDLWNEKAEREVLDVCLSQYKLVEDSKTLVDYIKEEFEFQKNVEEVDGKVIVVTDNFGYVIDKEKQTVIAQSKKEILEGVLAVKKEYIANQTTIKENKTSSVSDPYCNSSTKYPENDEALSQILPSYNKDNFKMSLQRGNLVCLYDPSIMTEEKIIMCEALDIYLLGDANGDHRLYYDDADIILHSAGNIKDERQRIVMDVCADANNIINNIDASSLKVKLSEIYLTELKNMRTEYLKTRKEKIDQGIAKEDMNAKTFEEVKEYIPSYTNDSKYKLKIQRGVLMFADDKNLDKYIISNSSIYLPGDVTLDGILNEDDVNILENYLADSTANPLIYDKKQIADLNDDGIVDTEDLERLRKLIND